VRPLANTSIDLENYCCPECGYNNPIFDTNRGDTICRNCGLILQEKMISLVYGGRKGKQIFSLEDFSVFHKGVKSFIEKTNKDFSGKYVTPENIELFRRIRCWDYRLTQNERRISKALEDLKIVSSSLFLSKGIRERIARFIQKFIKQHLIQGKSYLSFVCAATYLVLRKENFPVSLKEISEIFSLDIKKLTSVCFFILRKTKERIPPQNLKSLTVKICEKIKLSQQAQNLCCSMIEYIKNSIDFSGKSPTGIACAIIYLACLKNGEKRTQEEIAKVAGITPVTLRNRLKQIVEFFS